MFKSINYKIVVVATVVIGLLTAVCYFGSYARADGANEFVFKLLARLFYVFSFPFLYTFIGLQITNLLSLILGITLDSMFYAFVIERLIRLYKTKRDR